MAKRTGLKLTDQDFEDVAAGRLTTVELAARVGSTKQNVARHVRLHKARLQKAAPSLPALASPPSTPGASAVSAPAPSPTSPATAASASEPEEGELTDEERRQLLRHTVIDSYIRVVARAFDLLDEKLGPSALKATTSALGEATDRLTGLGMLDQQHAGPSRMTIDVYSPEEIAEIRRQAEGLEDGEPVDEDEDQEESEDA